MSERAAHSLKLAEIDEVELSIDKLVAGGDGFGRWEGVPLFVPRTAPGDRVRARITERRPDFGRAEVVEVLSPGPGRREPPCPYFERCGGCDLQHLEDDLQVRLKAAALIETLQRLGRIDIGGLAKPPDVIAAEPWAYRLRAQLHVDPDTPPAGVLAADPDAPGVGYFERGSHSLVAVDRCPILVPELEELLPELPRRLAEGLARSGGDRQPRRIDLASGDGVVTTAPVVDGLPHGPVTATVAGFELAFDARSFFQTHRGLLDRLVEVVLGPEEWTGERAFDLYCGVGLFTLSLARRYREVVGVEGDRVAIRFARNNARKNGMTGLRVEGMAVESWAGSADGLPEGADRVVVDPPRAGCHPQVVEALLAKRPRRLTYVSCHAATLARDLRKLGDAYRIERLTLLDLFPQSGHMEAVVQLESDAG